MMRRGLRNIYIFFLALSYFFFIIILSILNGKSDQRLCFRYSDSAVPPLLKSKISGSIHIQAGLCQNWSGNMQTGFLTPWLS